MVGTKKLTGVVHALSCAACLLGATADNGDKPPFFQMAISTQGRHSYLFGEDILLDVTVSNPGRGPLRYMAQGDFMAGVEFDVVQLGTGRRPPWDQSGLAVPRFGEPEWCMARVRTLRAKEQLRARAPLAVYDGEYPTGGYKIKLRLRTIADHDGFGLALGTAESNELQFEVKRWLPKVAVKKSIETPLREAIEKTTVELVETTEGQRLVSWETWWEVHSRREGRFRRVLPITLRVSPEEVLWCPVGRKACYVLSPGVDKAKPELFVVENEASSSLHLTLLPCEEVVAAILQSIRAAKLLPDVRRAHRASLTEKGPATAVLLLETPDGRLFLTWQLRLEARREGFTLPVEVEAPLSSLSCAATQTACYLVYPDKDGATAKLLVAHKGGSAQETMLLERGH